MKSPAVAFDYLGMIVVGVHMAVFAGAAEPDLESCTGDSETVPYHRVVDFQFGGI